MSLRTINPIIFDGDVEIRLDNNAKLMYSAQEAAKLLYTTIVYQSVLRDLKIDPEVDQQDLDQRRLRVDEGYAKLYSVVEDEVGEKDAMQLVTQIDLNIKLAIELENK